MAQFKDHQSGHSIHLDDPTAHAFTTEDLHKLKALFRDEFQRDAMYQRGDKDRALQDNMKATIRLLQTLVDEGSGSTPRKGIKAACREQMEPEQLKGVLAVVERYKLDCPKHRSQDRLEDSIRGGDLSVPTEASDYEPPQLEDAEAGSGGESSEEESSSDDGSEDSDEDAEQAEGRDEFFDDEFMVEEAQRSAQQDETANPLGAPIDFEAARREVDTHDFRKNEQFRHSMAPIVGKKAVEKRFARLEEQRQAGMEPDNPHFGRPRPNTQERV